MSRRRFLNAQRAAERLAREAAEAPKLRAAAVQGLRLNAIVEYYGPEYGWEISCEAAGGAKGVGESAPDALADLAEKWIDLAPEPLLRGYHKPKPSTSRPKPKPRPKPKAAGARASIA